MKILKGSKVVHSYYGNGVVISVRGMIYEVLFEEPISTVGIPKYTEMFPGSQLKLR